MRKRSGRPPRFAQVPNESVDDSQNMDLTALGLLTTLLRHKDGWDITLDRIGAKYGHGEDAMASAMGALQVARYVVKVRIQGAGNRWRTEVAVYAPPASDDEVEQLLADIRDEDPEVRRVEVIAPTGTAVKKADARRVKLAKKAAERAAKRAASAAPAGPVQDSPTPGIPGVGDCGSADSGVSRVPGNPRVLKKTAGTQEDEKSPVVADAVGKGAAGFPRAGASDGAGEESPAAEGGCAASDQDTPRSTTTRKSSSGPRTYRTKPRRELPGWQMVRDAIPAAVARPGTRLYPGLHRAINDLLTGNPAAGIPARTPEQVLARVNRRWFGEGAEERSAAGYRGCDRCTAAGCTAPRRSEDNPYGCDRIRNRSSWLAAAILAQDCPDAGCEDGQLLDGGACRACAERHAERREAAAAVAVAAARWEAETREHAVVTAWEEARAAEEHRYRQTLAVGGMHGQLLDHRVASHMAGWRERNPRPSKPQTAILGAPAAPATRASGPQPTGRQKVVRRTVVCPGCDLGHRTTGDDDTCPACREGGAA